MEPSEKLRLAYVVKYYHPMPRISGILRFVYDLVGALSSDFRIRVITFRYSPAAPAREEHHGYEILRLSRPFPWRAGRAARADRPDAVIFGSGFWQPYLLLPYWETFRIGLGPFPGPVILTQYTNMAPALNRLLSCLVPPPSLIVATTESLQKDWERLYPGKVACIAPGMPVAGEKYSGPIAPKKFALRIGYFGHLQAHKGPDILLKVFQEIRPDDCELLIQGEGEMMNALKGEARGWDNITIQGYQPEIDSWLRSCDLIVLPYRSGVSVLGYSRAALEALAAGIPLITTLNPSVAPLIEEGRNGFICRDEEELKERIRNLIEDKTLREKLAEGAFRSASRFEINTIAGQYKKLIRRQLSGEESP